MTRKSQSLYRGYLVCGFALTIPFLSPPLLVKAQETLPAVPSQPPHALYDTGSLADALSQARSPHTGIAMTVDGDKVSRLPDTMLSDVQPTVGEVAADYGRVTQSFGGVTAVAPPTMTILNTDLHPTDPYEGMPAEDAFKLLCGSLNDSQWHLLTSETGLGPDDLSEQQRHLWTAVVPGGETEILPENGGNQTYVKAIFLEEDDLKHVRLRLAQWIGIMAPFVGTDNAWVGSNSRLTSADQHPRYKVLYSLAKSQQATGVSPTLFGLTMRNTAPNTPKPSDFNFHAPVMETQVSLAGVKTIQDLVAHIQTATHLELYADRRYERREITFLGRSSASAGDLLRGLAFCVCGAYRQVGPAYVLTNDRIGLGTRHLIPSRLAQVAAEERKDREEAAADWLITQHNGIRDLPTLDGLDVTDEERMMATPLEPFDALPQSRLIVPWATLTPRQQVLAAQEIKAFNPAGVKAEQVAQPGKFLLQRHAVLQLLCPTVPGTLELSDSLTRSLFNPSERLRRDLSRPRQRAFSAMQKEERTKGKSQPTLQDVVAHLALFTRRAVFARPRTTAELDALLVAMKRLTLNQLWLDVFSQGESHIDGPRNLLTEALAKTKGRGIIVVPTVEMLTWGADAPADVRDYNIFGETPPMTGGVLPASPAAPAVQEALTTLMRKLAATPGVSVVALRDTVFSDYEKNYNYIEGPNSIGYAVPLRLSFLRRWYVDPIDADLKQNNIFLSVPEFDDSDMMQGINEKWDKWRSEADFYLMRQMLEAAQQGAGRRFPLLINKRGERWDTDWYSLWDDPNASLPILSSEAISTAHEDFARYAHQQSRLALYTPNLTYIGDRQFLINEINGLKPGWDGIVLFAGNQPADTALDGLVVDKPAPSSKPVDH